MNKGFSLIEILIAGLLTLFLGIFLVSILSNTSNTFNTENSLASQGVNSNAANDMIKDMIHQAAYVASGYPEDTPTFTTGDSTLVLKLPSIINSGSTQNIYDYVVISADQDHPNVLRLQLFPDSQSSRKNMNQVLTNELDLVHFLYLDSSGNNVANISAQKVGVDLSIKGRTSKIEATLRNQ